MLEKTKMHPRVHLALQRWVPGDIDVWCLDRWNVEYLAWSFGKRIERPGFFEISIDKTTHLQTPVAPYLLKEAERSRTVLLQQRRGIDEEPESLKAWETYLEVIPADSGGLCAVTGVRDVIVGFSGVKYGKVSFIGTRKAVASDTTAHHTLEGGPRRLHPKEVLQRFDINVCRIGFPVSALQKGFLSEDDFLFWNKKDFLDSILTGECYQENSFLYPIRSAKRRQKYETRGFEMRTFN